MSQIVLDFNKPLLFLDGKPINEPKQKTEDPDVPVMINKMLATNLSQSAGGKDANSMKLFYWSIELYKEGKLTLDKVDRDLLKKTVTDMNISILVQGRTIEILDLAEKAAEAKEVKKDESAPQAKETVKQPALAKV